MGWPDKELITAGVLNMLQVNMGWQEGERLLVLTDLPTGEQWRQEPPARLMVMLERAMLARLVADIAVELYPHSPVEFHAFPATGSHGAEPDPETAQKMAAAEVVIAITSYSLSHTDARERATQAGVRLASMPTFLAEMFYPDGPMAVDYQQIAAEARAVARLLTAADQVQVRSPAGTDICFRLGERVAKADRGLYTAPGDWGNLPAGEAYIAPLEGTATGVIVAPAGWYPGLEEDLHFYLEQGDVVDIQGGGAVGDHFRELLRPGLNEEPYRSRRNLAELGVGTNPNARRPTNVLEAEKIRGTVHLALGDNAHMGGTVSADMHEDFVIPSPDLTLDGRLVMQAGKWVVEL